MNIISSILLKITFRFSNLIPFIGTLNLLAKTGILQVALAKVSLETKYQAWIESIKQIIWQYLR